MIDSPSVELVDLHDDPGPWTIGGKAAGLHRLAAAGLPVPPGAVVPAEATDGDVDRLADHVCLRWPGGRLAVRSSGATEDSAEASFAGQFDTVLDVEPAAGVLAGAIRRVRASTATDRVAAYGPGADLRMAVLVMPMVRAAAAGIAFTRDPVSGARVVVVEAVPGVADRLAAGEATGERWTVADTPRCTSDAIVLSADQVVRVAELARRVEQLEGTAQDIEWAIADGRVQLLQARPITTLDDLEPLPMDDEVPPGSWEWDSTHSRRPASPLLADVFPAGMERGSRMLAREYGVPFDHLALRAINGYFYIQVVPPVGRPGSPPPPALLSRLLFRVVPVLRRRHRAARRAFAEGAWEGWHRRWRSEVRPAIEATLSEWHGLDLAELSDDQLARVLTEAVELQRHTFSWNMVTDPAYLVPLAELARFVDRHLDGGFATTIRLLAGASHPAYRDALRTLAEQATPPVREAVAAGGDVLARLEATAPAFADAYRDHQRAFGTLLLGYDLTDPTLREDPAAELRRVVTLPAEDGDPSAEARALADDLAAGLPDHRRGEFEQRLADARATYWIREEGEGVHSTVLGALRRVMLEVGRRLVAAGHVAQPDHAAFLTVDELTGWLRAPTDVAATVRTRRAQHRWAAQQRPPETFGPPAALPGPGSLPPEVARLMEVFALVLAHDQRPAELAGDTDGVAASAGTHTGPVRVIRRPDEFSTVQPGEVLVAPITNSTWEVLFPHIGALVTEGGGLLSHPAIVAREYRLPAVVGCEHATDRFHDGQLVTVDGHLGTVTPVTP